MENKPTYEELQAQVEALHDAFSELVGRAGTEPNEFNQVIINKIDFDAVHDCFAATPQHHLRELRADAVLDGWFACEKWFYSDDADSSECCKAANQYADSIRQEGKWWVFL